AFGGALRQPWYPHGAVGHALLFLPLGPEADRPVLAPVRAALGLPLLFREVDVQLGGAAQGLPGFALAGCADRHRQPRHAGGEEAVLQGLGPAAGSRCRLPAAAGRRGAAPAQPRTALTHHAGGSRRTPVTTGA